MNKRRVSLVLMLIALTLIVVGLSTPLSLKTQAATTAQQNNIKSVLDQINAFRTDPANAKATLDKLIAAGFPNVTERETMLKEKYGEKTRAEHLAEFVLFMQSQTKTPALQWDNDLATIAGNEGKSNNQLFTPAHNFDTFDINPARALLWSLLGGVDFHYKPLFAPNLQFCGIAAKADKLYITVTDLKGKAYLMSDEEVGRNAYDSRLDNEPAWVNALAVKEPNIIPFVKADGSIDLVWRRMSDKKVFINRYSANGAKVWTKEVGGVSDQYILLAGFTEDPQGNIYIARAIDEGNINDKVEPATPKTNPNNAYDRPDLMRLTKLDKDAKELWTKDIAKKGGGASAFFSPLSPNEKNSYAATSKLAYTTIKQSFYTLASDEKVVVPPAIAEQCLLGFDISKQGERKTSNWDAKFVATESGGILQPKVGLEFYAIDSKYGTVKKPIPNEKPTVVEFNTEGIPTNLSDLSYDLNQYEAFNGYLLANMEAGADPNRAYVKPEKLKLKMKIEAVPLVFVIYGAATDWDPSPEYKSRHQNAYWRVLDARTGEPIQDYNQAAMAHSFDYSLLVTDEGIITAERSDGFMLLANYMNTRRPAGPIFLAAFNTVSSGNECYCSIGGLAPASDGYMFLYAANNTKYDVTFNRDDGLTDAQINEEETRQRDIGIMRVKKGFAQEIDNWADKDMKVLKDLLDSRKKPAAANSLFLTRPKYITSYFRENQPYSAGRARFVRVADGNYIVFWERWNHIVKKNSQGQKALSGSYDSTWAMKIDQNGNVVKPAVKISDNLRLMRGDDPVLWDGKAAFFSGDIIEGKMVLHTIDTNLTHKATMLPLN